MPAMPSTSSERLRSATIHSARLPPRHRNGSIDTTSSSAPSSSVAGISIMKPAKAASSRPLRRRTPSIDDLTPFDAHLKDIYAGKADATDGLAFFESHGYYDVPEANTVDMFRSNFGMKKQFWDGADHDLVFYEEINLDTVDLAALEVLSVGTLLTANATTSGVKRHRTTSGRFQLLDDDGNVVDPESHMEAEREKRMKLQHMEVDDDDAEELANAQILLVKAITVIRTEHTRFKKYFYEACTEEMNRQQSVAIVPAPAPTLAEVNVPAYSGYLYVLKDTIPHLFRSWHKRWVYLDFDNGLARMYKRSYWKSERGVLDMRSVRAITRMNQSDICIQCYDGRSMLFRTKDGAQEAEMWLNFLQVARRKFGTGSAVVVSPTTLQLTQPLAKNDKMALTTTTTTTTTTTMSAGSILISTKVGKPQDRTMLDVVALLAKASSSSTATTSAGTNSVTAA